MTIIVIIFTALGYLLGVRVEKYRRTKARGDRREECLLQSEEYGDFSKFVSRFEILNEAKNRRLYVRIS